MDLSELKNKADLEEAEKQIKSAITTLAGSLDSDSDASKRRMETLRTRLTAVREKLGRDVLDSSRLRVQPESAQKSSGTSTRPQVAQPLRPEDLGSVEGQSSVALQRHSE